VCIQYFNKLNFGLFAVPSLLPVTSIDLIELASLPKAIRFYLRVVETAVVSFAAGRNSFVVIRPFDLLRCLSSFTITSSRALLRFHIDVTFMSKHTWSYEESGRSENTTGILMIIIVQSDETMQMQRSKRIGWFNSIQSSIKIKCTLVQISIR
jgi:hypothetical protein